MNIAIAIIVAMVAMVTSGVAVTAKWQAIPGSLTRISKGRSGVWGVNRRGNIYKLNGKSWTRIPGNLEHISSGGSSVWGVNKHGHIYRDAGHNKWQRIPGSLTNLDVSDNGHVWGVKKNQDIYRWTGKNWQHIGGKAIQVTVGPSGVWIVNRANNIYYRKGTYGDSNTAGSGWIQISGNLKWISSGRNIVVGVDSGNNIYYREGMRAPRPTGTGWVQIPGKLMQIDIYGDEIVGVDTGHVIYKFPVSGFPTTAKKTVGWFPVERDVVIEWDLESTPLEIKSSELGSNDNVLYVTFYSAWGMFAGGLWLDLASPLYSLQFCTSFKKFAVNPPSTADKVWRITLTRTEGVRVVVHCNEVEVLNILLSQSCTETKWSKYWNRLVTKMKFRKADSASDYYRAQPVDGGWSDYSKWGACSVGCGKGTTTRSKTCNNPPPARGGKDCGGEAVESKECMNKAEFPGSGSTPVPMVAMVTSGVAVTAKWQAIPGSLTRISIGRSGVWGVKRGSKVYKLNGKSWTRIPGRFDHISSGSSVWGVTRRFGSLFYRDAGHNKWQGVRGYLFSNLDVSDNGHVWGV
ncbi:uncharacterized protein LOC134822077 [Bolinopsis microptera]|uniref:uncharacterized protein LOC134822077 n=1 Tax=Bolinopsis microptera TaxID=2820187 RepID=UPI00307A9D84